MSDQNREDLRRNIVFHSGQSAIKRELAGQFRDNPTPTEALLWERIRRRQIGYHFRRQQVIGGFIVDFYCHKVGLVIEIDGPIHEQQREYDQERERILKARGLHLLRFTNDQVNEEIGTVLNKILKACKHLEREQEH